MSYKIYCLKNESGRIVYVGQTTRSLNVRLGNHKQSHPHRENYTIHLIEETTGKEIADSLETYYIKKYDLVENGENITYGKGTKGLGANNTSFKKGNQYGKIGVKQVQCVESGIVYSSITYCATILELNPSHITACCKGKRKTTGGYHFIYV